jgi:phosphatidylglycerophosphate synthase
MKTALILLLLQGCLGAFDTIYYHEFKLRLPDSPASQYELALHASRDFIYAVIFCSLAWATYNGVWVWALAALLLLEIIITLLDFIQEDRTRKVPAGERVMHAVMGIVYGAFLAHLLPQMIIGSRLPTGFTQQSYGWLSWLLTMMAAGVFLSGLRDLLAARSKGIQRSLLQRQGV